jgi:hypothetical protein
VAKRRPLERLFEASFNRVLQKALGSKEVDLPMVGSHGETELVVARAFSTTTTNEDEDEKSEGDRADRIATIEDGNHPLRQ